MALENLSFIELIKASRNFKGPVKLLSLGYPDLLVQEAVMQQMAQEIWGAPMTNFETTKLAEDGESISRWHRWKEPIYDTTEVLRRFYIYPEYIDIHASRGVERVVDLNVESSLGPTSYDIILDPGTLEHCFNIGVAWKNVWSSLKTGGYLIHTNPVTMMNHGFYNLNPTAYHDVYTQNGGELLTCKGLVGPLDGRQSVDLPPTSRFMTGDHEITSLIVAKKTIEQEFKWPTQTKYLKNKNLKA